MELSVVIPTRNARKYIAPLLERLLEQSLRAEILVIDSGSTDGTAELVRRCAPRVRLLAIPAGEFDHGGTRDRALRAAAGELVFFLSQDALPEDERYLETMCAPFADERVGAVFARQVAREDAPLYERLNREYNYPPGSRVWGREDIPRLGLRAVFFSDAASAYRRSAYEAVGGFDAPIPANEDMLIASKLLRRGYRLGYCAETIVRHSHDHTLAQEFSRSERVGRAMERYSDRLPDTGPGAEGRRMVCSVVTSLLRRDEPGAAGIFLLHAAARFAGYCRGRRIEAERSAAHADRRAALDLQRGALPARAARESAVPNAGDPPSRP